MEIVSIEKKTFEMMVASFNALAEKVAALRRRSDGGRMERWLTGEEVCGQLRISPRTLQTLRDRRLIGYSQINRRFYYKPEEVKKLIPLVGTLYPCGKGFDFYYSQPTESEMMMNENNEVFTMEDEPLASVVQNMRKGSKWLSAFLESYRPPLDGERYLTDREVAELLRVSRRTLQEYRNNRVLPFILLGGKVLYPESGLRELLEANYRKPME